MTLLEWYEREKAGGGRRATTHDEESEMTRAPQGYRPCEMSGCPRWTTSPGACWTCCGPTAVRVAAAQGYGPDWQPPIQPPGPETTWRGMRVGQTWKGTDGLTREVVAATATTVTTALTIGGRIHTWGSEFPFDRRCVESWTLVSDAGEAPAKASDWKEVVLQHEPAAAPAKVEPAKVLRCALYNKSRHAGQVLMRSFGSAPVPACEACYMENERYAATGTPFTEPEKAPAAKPPRYPESNDIDQDIADA